MCVISLGLFAALKARLGANRFVSLAHTGGPAEVDKGGAQHGSTCEEEFWKANPDYAIHNKHDFRSYDIDAEWRSISVCEMNRERALVGSPPLVWDDALARTADKWATVLQMDGCHMEHSTHEWTMRLDPSPATHLSPTLDPLRGLLHTLVCCLCFVPFILCLDPCSVSFEHFVLYRATKLQSYKATNTKRAAVISTNSSDASPAHEDTIIVGHVLLTVRRCVSVQGVRSARWIRGTPRGEPGVELL